MNKYEILIKEQKELSLITERMLKKNKENLERQKKENIIKTMKECLKEFKKIQKAIEKNTEKKVLLETNIENAKLSLQFDNVEVGLMKKEDRDGALFLYLKVGGNLNYAQSFYSHQIKNMFFYIEEIMRNEAFIKSIR